MAGITTRPARAPGDATRQLADHRRVLDEVARDPYLNGRDIDVTLQPGVPLEIKHGLGRAFTSYSFSAPRGGAGAAADIVETARTKDGVTLEVVTAGAAVTITLRIW